MKYQCQFQNLLDSGSELKVPLKIRIKKHLKKYKVINELKKKVDSVKKQIHKEKNLISKKKVNGNKFTNNLALEKGEVVRIRSEKEIESTLDENNCFESTIFLEGMWKFCGKKAKVYKRIENILDYRTNKMWKVRDTVILEDVYCENDPSELIDCDQTCFYYWKEAWLERERPIHNNTGQY